MNAGLLKDLVAWESGELSSQELASRHGAEASSMAAVHERLAFVALRPAPDAEAGWAALVQKLEDHPIAPVVELKPSRRKAALLAIAAAMMLGGTALALSGAPEDDDVLSGQAIAVGPVGGPGAFHVGSHPSQDHTVRPAGSTAHEATAPDAQGHPGSGAPSQAAEEDQQGVHPGEGNDGVDNGKDGHPKEGSDEGAKGDGAEEPEEPDESDDTGPDEPSSAGPSKGGKSEEHGEPSEKSESSQD